MPTQAQMYYQAERRAGEANQTFLELVKDGLTREELERNIERRPELWGRYTNWLDKLPSSADAGAAQDQPAASVKSASPAP